MLTVSAVLKTSIFMYKLLWLLFGQLFEKFVLLNILSSGHTDWEQTNDINSRITKR